MKKLLVISSVLIAFSAASLFANESNAVNNVKGQAISTASMDTVPKKDTTKKDTTFLQLQERK
ncbi:MAG: hypothetical protein ABIQ88_22405 [Chitinophagaceae bacterium]